MGEIAVVLGKSTVNIHIYSLILFAYYLKINALKITIHSFYIDRSCLRNEGNNGLKFLLVGIVGAIILFNIV